MRNQDNLTSGQIKKLKKQIKKLKIEHKAAKKDHKKWKARLKKRKKKLEALLAPLLKSVLRARQDRRKKHKKYKKAKLRLRQATQPTAASEKKVPATAILRPMVASQEKNDLKKVEGIGPKIEELLQAAGVRTFADLAATSIDKLKEILITAGTRYRMHNPTTWPEQATLARDEHWAELKMLQAKLKGGRK